MTSFDNQDEVLSHVENCEETESDQNINMGEEDVNMEEEKPIWPFCEKSFKTKDEVEQHILMH